ncbi:MAG: TRAP transporter large permease subunit [Comamonadaceae bacterium]|nr:TRAP transporter large permease subunit [Comamonadaceae bacterium]
MPHGDASVLATIGRVALRVIEGGAALLMFAIVVLLLGGVAMRYLFALPAVWIDEVASLSFMWLAMVGSTIAMRRNEHLRLSALIDRLAPPLRGVVQAFALVMVLAFLAALLWPAIDYAWEEWFITTPALGIPNTVRVLAMPFGIACMLVTVAAYCLRTVSRRQLIGAVAAVGAVGAICWLATPWLADMRGFSMLLFLVGVVSVCLAAGVPIAFCFGLGTVCFLSFSSQVPLQVVIGRMDEGMSNMLLVSVPIFVLLGCILDATGMGKAIVDFLSSLLGHIKAGMSYVLLGSLFIVSGISGSKVSDMATVAPALFPEMRRRGHKPKEMVALLGTGAAMADTVPPSIVLIVLGSVAGVSIAGLFQAGFVVALVLLLTLLVLARWKARHEDMGNVRRATLPMVGKLLLIATPALLLPFLIRSAVGSGVATATEVSTIAVVYALFIGKLLYGGIGWRKMYDMLVETAALSGAILLILGTASAMAWAITQSGVIQSLSQFLTSLPGGSLTFMAVTIAIFLVLGCLLEGLPAVLLLAPIMFPIARSLGINDIHYAMVVVTTMNVGLMMPPIGVGFYVACRIGEAKPDEVISAIWPYLLALLIGVGVIAAVPAISTYAL